MAYKRIKTPFVGPDFDPEHLALWSEILHQMFYCSFSAGISADVDGIKCQCCYPDIRREGGTKECPFRGRQLDDIKVF